jgi:hypothetical protein
MREIRSASITLLSFRRCCTVKKTRLSGRALDYCRYQVWPDPDEWKERFGVSGFRNDPFADL